MIGQIAALIRKDIMLSKRDSIVNYIIIAPIFIAILVRIFLPTMENMEVTFAVSRDIDSDFVYMLSEYGKVEVLNDRNQVIKRVMALDDVPGIVPTKNGLEVILEGNEMSAVHDLPGMIIDYYNYGKFISDIQIKSLEVENLSVRYYAGAVVIFTVILIGGLAVGMTIVEERQSKTIKSLAVSPLTLKNYLFSKMLLAVLLIFILAITTAYIMMGLKINFGMFILIMITTLPAGMLVGFILGAYSHDQMSAIAVMKVLMLFFVGIPVASFFINDSWHVFFYPLSNYWIMQSLVSLFSGNVSQSFIKSFWAFLTAVVPLFFFLKQMKKKLNF